MRFVRCLAVCAALFSCSAQNVVVLQECSREAGVARGARDGKAGRNADLSFLQNCSPENQSVASVAYREAFDAAKARRNKVESNELGSAAMAAPVGREPAGQRWVCEVEANSKVFTGTGISRDEALGSAKSTCVSHFQASNCTQSECKQSL